MPTALAVVSTSLLLLAAAPPAESITLYLAATCNKFPHPHPCGADTNSGLTPDAPLETLLKARDLLRARSDDEKHVGLYAMGRCL